MTRLDSVAPRAKIVLDDTGRFYGIRINCPGCASRSDGSSGGHVLPVDWTPEGRERSPRDRRPWGFNGDLGRPTLSPSILSQQSWGEDRRMHVCHSFVADGRIQFLDDCTHALAGKTVDLPELDEAACA